MRQSHRAALPGLGTQARATTQNTFLALKRIEVSGLGEKDQVRVFTADYTQEDCSLFLPLWAGAPDPRQAQQMIEDTLLRRYLQPFGIPLCPPDLHPQVDAARPAHRPHQRAAALEPPDRRRPAALRLPRHWLPTWSPA